MSLPEQKVRVLIMAGGRAVTECPADICSAASARTGVKPSKHPVNVYSAERAHRKCALDNARSRKRNAWCGLEFGLGALVAPGTATHQEGLCAS